MKLHSSSRSYYGKGKRKLCEILFTICCDGLKNAHGGHLQAYILRMLGSVRTLF